MNKFLQMLCYALTFFTVSVVGNFFGFFLPDMQGYFAQFMPGKPLPQITLFFLAQHHAVPHLFLIPWLFFVGLPFVLFQRISYWNAERFLLRFTVFISMELTLLFVLLVGCLLPCFGITDAMFETAQPTWFETSMRGLFWLLVLLIGLAAATRLCWPRRKPSTVSE